MTEYRAWIVECRALVVEHGAWTVGCGIWVAECEQWRVKCGLCGGVWIVNSGSWNLGGGVWDRTVEGGVLTVEPGMGRKEWRLVFNGVRFESCWK